MIDKEKYLIHIKDLKIRQLTNRVLDIVHIVLKKHEVKYTHFLNPYEKKCVIQLINAFPDLAYKSFGGFEDAEREIVAIYQDYLDDNSIEVPISAIEITSKSRNEINHRDILGAALGLGLKREKLGDILIHKNKYQLIVDKTLIDFLIFNLTHVGSNEVKLKNILLSNIQIPIQEYKEIQGFVASLRLDAIISLAFKLSRGDAQSVITKDKVTVNWETVNKNNSLLKEGDIISLRGKGRIEIKTIGRRTKSDRTQVIIKKPL
ncbi:YlmH/Sll1252 family protein [Serpentinicella sp. ANB-PHB4]|uniref:YlmH family RNA-binding protein n=1 Tax=Serpentinicella sp. ANB-PHB4 TaxID=3074076 RepID=UPI00285BB67F|nr:YlmH/Sll1252 family protein [Serpentinicella sp. ANB-PHB4]MDR5657924.1 YlmH/Sll1252 family protein [Serpentinicella sp. ANB-PHB4]